MIKYVLAAFLMLASCGAFATPEPAAASVLDGYTFKAVASLSQLPDAIKTSLGVGREGMTGIAENGQPFNLTDVVDSSLPMRRLASIGRDGDTWLVALEVGGRGYSVQVFLYKAGSLPPTSHWTLRTRPNDLADLLNMLDQSPATKL